MRPPANIPGILRGTFPGRHAPELECSHTPLPDDFDPRYMARSDLFLSAASFDPIPLLAYRRCPPLSTPTQSSSSAHRADAADRRIVPSSRTLSGLEDQRPSAGTFWLADAAGDGRHTWRRSPESAIQRRRCSSQSVAMAWSPSLPCRRKHTSCKPLQSRSFVPECIRNARSTPRRSDGGPARRRRSVSRPLPDHARRARVSGVPAKDGGHAPCLFPAPPAAQEEHHLDHLVSCFRP